MLAELLAPRTSLDFVRADWDARSFVVSGEPDKPPGTVHETEAETDSVAVFIIFGQRSPGALFASLMDRIFSPVASWRFLPPFVYSESNAGELPERIVRELDARRSEAPRFFASVRADGLELAYSLMSSVAGTKTHEPEQVHAVGLPLTRSARMSFASARPLVVRGRAMGGQLAAFLVLGGREAELSAEALRLIERMMSHDTFFARDVADADPASALAWDRTKVLLQTLLDGGFLRRLEDDVELPASRTGSQSE